jgi:hypothetical protein
MKNWRLAAGCWLLATGSWLFAACSNAVEVCKFKNSQTFFRKKGTLCELPLVASRQQLTNISL